MLIFNIGIFGSIFCFITLETWDSVQVVLISVPFSCRVFDISMVFKIAPFRAVISEVLCENLAGKLENVSSREG
jgi:hypothetical protein